MTDGGRPTKYHKRHTIDRTRAKPAVASRHIKETGRKGAAQPRARMAVTPTRQGHVRSVKRVVATRAAAGVNTAPIFPAMPHSLEGRDDCVDPPPDVEALPAVVSEEP
jgi:hypothetical protein